MTQLPQQGNCERLTSICVSSIRLAWIGQHETECRETGRKFFGEFFAEKGISERE